MNIMIICIVSILNIIDIVVIMNFFFSKNFANCGYYEYYGIYDIMNIMIICIVSILNIMDIVVIMNIISIIGIMILREL